VSHCLTGVVKLALLFDGETGTISIFQNEEVTYTLILDGTAYNISPFCIAHYGIAECDWIACAELQL